MKAIAYNIQPKDKEHLIIANYKKHDITFIGNHLNADTLAYAQGKEALIIFNNEPLNAAIIEGLKSLGIKYITTSWQQTHHIDISCAVNAGFKIANVPTRAILDNPQARMQQVIANLDNWEAGNCLGIACCCYTKCDVPPITHI